MFSFNVQKHGYEMVKIVAPPRTKIVILGIFSANIEPEKHFHFMKTLTLNNTF